MNECLETIHCQIPSGNGNLLILNLILVKSVAKFETFSIDSFSLRSFLFPMISPGETHPYPNQQFHQKLRKLIFDHPEGDILFLERLPGLRRHPILVIPSRVSHLQLQLGISDWISSKDKNQPNDKTEQWNGKDWQDQGQSPKNAKEESQSNRSRTEEEKLMNANLNPSDWPGTPNSIILKTVKTLKAQS
ncbi:hypothetical protein Tco_0767144 [Tanacetum coccineum]